MTTATREMPRNGTARRAPSNAPHVELALAYARGVVAGEIVVCKWVRLACERHLRDLDRQGEDGWPYWFSDERAERVCQFVEGMPHIKGRWAGSLLVLEPWQCFILCVVFGWLRVDTGMRRFRTVYIEVPRKNAKSTLTAAVGNYMLAADGEGGAEVYSAAKVKDQAHIVFDIAHAMTLKSADFREFYGVEANGRKPPLSLTVLDTSSRYVPLSSEDKNLDGLNVHFGGIDELHAHPTREVFDVLETGMGARTQPLLWCITTAGSNRAGICYEQRTYVTKILERVAEDETYFGIIYTIDTDEGDDPLDPAVWAKANPNLGVSTFPDQLDRLAVKAREMPSAMNNFLTKHLNVWVNADQAWMDMGKWEKCADPLLKIEDFAGERCIVGVDLASKIDIAAAMILFRREVDGEQHYYVFGRYWLPEERVEQAGNSQYSGWARAGILNVTDGAIIDFEEIETELDGLVSKHELIEVPYDPFQATEFATRMMARGLPMVEMRPTVLNFSEPMKQLDALVRDGRFHFDGDPALTWMISNVVAHYDNKDNIYPKKERIENKIDGPVALISALGRWIVLGEPKRSVYEDRGVRTL